MDTNLPPAYATAALALYNRAIAAYDAQLARETLLAIQNIECTTVSHRELHLTVGYELSFGDDDLIEVLFSATTDGDETTVTALRVTGRMPAGTHDVIPCDEALHEVTAEMLSGDRRVLEAAEAEWSEQDALIREAY